MEIVFFIAGLIFAAIGGYIVWDSYLFRRSAVEGAGLIIGYDVKHSQSKKGGGGKTYAPVVEYQHQGRTHRFTGRLHSSHINREIGDNIDILISQKDSAEARLKSRGMMIFGGVSLLVGLIFVTIFFVTFQLSIFSLGIAIVVIGVLAFKIMQKLNEKNIRSIDDIRMGIAEHSLTQGAVKKSVLDNGAIVTDPSELMMLKRTSKVSSKIIWLFFIIGLGMLVGGGFFVKSRAEFLEAGLRSSGVIVDFQRVTSTSSNGGTSTTYYPIVRYQPTGSATQITFKHNAGSSHTSYRRGDRVTVVYAPTDPNDAMIDDGWMNWLAPGIILLIGLVFALVGGVSLARRRKEEEKQKNIELEI